MSPEFTDHGGASSQQAWSDVVIRPVGPRDVPACASLVAAREGWPPERAQAAVTSWAQVSGADALMLVAERQGEVHGYGRASVLDPSSQGGSAPTGWYLTGLLVAPTARRRGLGRRLTEDRVQRLRDRTDEVWCFVNARNAASIALHERLGFRLHSRRFTIPGVTFEGGTGALYRLELRGRPRTPRAGAAGTPPFCP